MEPPKWRFGSSWFSFINVDFKVHFPFIFRCEKAEVCTSFCWSCGGAQWGPNRGSLPPFRPGFLTFKKGNHVRELESSVSRLGGTRQRVVFHLLPLVQAETRTSVPAANAVEVNFKSLRLKMFLGVLGLNSFTDMSIRQNYWMNRVVRSCLELWSSSWNLHNR